MCIVHSLKMGSTLILIISAELQNVRLPNLVAILVFFQISDT